MNKFLGVLPLAALVGCTTSESLQDRPIDWSATYNVPWETMANCIQADFPGSMVSPRYNQANKTAVLTINGHGIIMPGPAVSEFLVTGIGEQSRVEHKGWPGYGTMGRKLADRCGRSA